jgi:predicted molibdopterin-dependent oxidoreductase YjgC
VQDMFASPLWNVATYQLPGGAFPEREGSYVNYAERLQFAKWAIRPPVGAWVEGQLYWRLLDRPGLFNGRRVLTEVATEVAAFHLALSEIPPTGVDLKINKLASNAEPVATV